MATAETVKLNVAHRPKEESLRVFSVIETDLKETLKSTRRDHDKHEPEYFLSVQDLTDSQLTTFSTDNFEEVRVGTSAYGLHLFGKVCLPEAKSKDAYIMFRAFIPGEAESAKLHSIHTKEQEHSDGSKSYRAIFSKNDALEWFDT